LASVVRILVLALLLVGAVAGLRRLLAGYPHPPGRWQVLSPGEVALLEAAADTIYPPGGPVPPSGCEAGVPVWVDGYVAALPARMRLLTRALLMLVENATLLFPAPPPRGWRRFSALSPPQRSAALEGWRTSRLFPRRLVFMSLRAILTMGYFASPAVLRAVGLAPRAVAPAVVEADLLFPRVGRRRDSIAFTAADLRPSDGRPVFPDAPLHPDFAEGGR
jgi:hypothetical protein